MKSVDIFKRSRQLTLSFELNIDKWKSMDSTVRAAVSSGWKSIKYLNDDGTGVNDRIAEVPNDCGGIYIFLLKPDIIFPLHRYIMYIGRARRKKNYSLQARCRTYFKDSRPAVANMIEQWGKELFLFYLPVEDTDEFIEKIDQELIRVIIPPCNTQIPYHYTEKTDPLF